MTALAFWFIAWGLTLLVLGVLVWPMLTRRETQIRGEMETRAAVYRQQLAELEQDHRQAAITDAQYEQAKCDIERRLLAEMKLAEAARPIRPGRLSTRAVAVTIAVLIPAVSGVLYWKLGTPPAVGESTSALSPTRTATGYDHQTAEGLDILTERLKKKLTQNPNDPSGWALLARSYVELGRYADAVQAFERATTLAPDDPQLLADYADALGMLHDRKFGGKAENLIRKALTIDPDNVKALMLAGTVAFDRKEFKRAAQYWERAVRNLPADADGEVKRELEANIAEATSLAKGKPALVPGSSDPAAPPKAFPAGAAITGTVTLAPALAARGAPGDTVFIFAREVGGPPMPLAAVRMTKRDLPFTFRLDDSTSPMPSRRLSAAREVVVVARLSKSGSATPASGDLEGQSAPVKPGTTGVTVVIDKELP